MCLCVSAECEDTLRLRPQQLAALEADLAARSHIKFAFDSCEPSAQGRLLRAPTPYPKELRELAKHARNLQKLERRPQHSVVVCSPCAVIGRPCLFVETAFRFDDEEQAFTVTGTFTWWAHGSA